MTDPEPTIVERSSVPRLFPYFRNSASLAHLAHCRRGPRYVLIGERLGMTLPTFVAGLNKTSKAVQMGIGLRIHHCLRHKRNAGGPQSLNNIGGASGMASKKAPGLHSLEQSGQAAIESLSNRHRPARDTYPLRLPHAQWHRQVNQAE